MQVKDYSRRLAPLRVLQECRDTVAESSDKYSAKFIRRTLLTMSFTGLFFLFSSSVSARDLADNWLTIVKPDQTVYGQVVTSKNEPISGVSVIVKDTKTGTLTDEHGWFHLPVPEGGTLIISGTGYIPQEVAPSGTDTLHIVLKETASDLDDVVVIGYGTQKKINLSGAVQSVSGKALENRPVNNINAGLEGLIPNLNITPGSGRSTDAASFNIRGVASLNGGSPLILVDNVPVTAAEIARLNPADVENVTVLKDAGSAAIYGARAAFGVVMITTKSAKNSKLQVSADFNYGLKTNGAAPDIVTDPLLTMQYKHDAATPLYDLYPEAQLAYARKIEKDPSLPRVIVDPTNPDAWAYYGSTNWMDEIYHNLAPAYTGSVSVAKKDDKLSYYVSAGYYRQEGALRYGNDVLNRYNFRANATYQLTHWLKFGTNTSYNYSEYNSPSFVDGLLFWNVNRTPSLSVPKNPDGTWTKDGAAILGALQEGGRKQDDVNDFQATFNTVVNLWKDNWTLKADATFRRTNETITNHNLPVPYRTGPDQPFGYSLTAGVGSNSFASNAEDLMKLNVYNIYTDFHKTFGEKHYLQALAGFNQEYRYYHDFSVSRPGLISASLPTPQLATGVVSQTDFIADYALRGFFYRLNYIYDDKYIVELNARNDGTSRFPEHDRWGFFPSASAAWVLSKESFFAPAAESIHMDLFKLRGSYGSLGNQVLSDNLKQDNYPYYATMNSRQISSILDGVQPVAVFMPGVVSPSQTWEKVRTVNLGTDLSFFNNKIEINYDWYTRYTDGMLTKSKTLPAVFGTSEPQTNAADLKTRGWELSVAWRDEFNVGGAPLSLSARLSLANSKTYITKYDNPNGILSDYYVGERLGQIWGLVNDGFFQNEEELAAIDQTAVGSDDQKYKFYVGDLRFKDLNGDKKITTGDNTVTNPGDQKIIGNNSKQYPYSADINASWKGFDIRVFIQGVGKRDWYPNPSNIYYWGVYAQPWTNVTTQNLNHWTPDNPNALYPRLKAYIAEDKSELGYPQTRYLQDASYMRVKNLTLGYSIPAKLATRWKISRLRFYVSAENLLTVKHLDANMDPEGLDGDIYPFQKTYSFGINLNF